MRTSAVINVQALSDETNNTNTNSNQPLVEAASDNHQVASEAKLDRAEARALRLKNREARFAARKEKRETRLVLRLSRKDQRQSRFAPAATGDDRAVLRTLLKEERLRNKAQRLSLKAERQAARLASLTPEQRQALEERKQARLASKQRRDKSPRAPRLSVEERQARKAEKLQAKLERATLKAQRKLERATVKAERKAARLASLTPEKRQALEARMQARVAAGKKPKLSIEDRQAKKADKLKAKLEKATLRAEQKAARTAARLARKGEKKKEKEALTPEQRLARIAARKESRLNNTTRVTCEDRQARRAQNLQRKQERVARKTAREAVKAVVAEINQRKDKLKDELKSLICLCKLPDTHPAAVAHNALSRAEKKEARIARKTARAAIKAAMKELKDRKIALKTERKNIACPCALLPNAWTSSCPLTTPTDATTDNNTNNKCGPHHHKGAHKSFPQLEEAIVTALPAAGGAVLVDGNNIMPCDSALRSLIRRNMGEARAAFLVMLNEFAARHPELQITCMFDRDGLDRQEGSVSVLHSGASIADDVIVNLVRDLAPASKPLVITSDRELICRLFAVGANSMKSGFFYRLITAEKEKATACDDNNNNAQ